MNGSIANSAVTLNGGQLKGNGTVGSLTVLSGSVAPGNSIGTLNVAGNFSMAANTNYDVELNGARRLRSEGAARERIADSACSSPACLASGAGRR